MSAQKPPWFPQLGPFELSFFVFCNCDYVVAAFPFLRFLEPALSFNLPASESDGFILRYSINTSLHVFYLNATIALEAIPARPPSSLQKYPSFF